MNARDKRLVEAGIDCLNKLRALAFELEALDPESSRLIHAASDRLGRRLTTLAWDAAHRPPNPEVKS